LEREGVTQQQQLSKGNVTSIIGLDIEGAFDNVDQMIIINKMNEELGKHHIRH